MGRRSLSWQTLTASQAFSCARLLNGKSMTSPRIAPSSFSSEANCLFAYAKVRYFTGMWQKKTRNEPSGILLALRSSPEYGSVPFMRGDAWKGMSGCPLARGLCYNSFRVYRLYEHDDRAQRKSLAVLLVVCLCR